MKKVYEPGEMYHAGCYIQNPSQWVEWDKLEQRNKDVWAMRERIFLYLVRQQVSRDEQTDDSSGLPAGVME